MCPTALGKIGNILGTGFLKCQTFKDIIDKNPFIREIELANWGEILLNPDLPRLLEYASQKNVILNADNGNNLNDASDEALEAVVKYGLRNMRCSIDGASPETYKIYRVRGDFNKVIANVKKINFYKEKYHSPYPKLLWQFIAFGHNEHEIPAARKMARELGMDFWVKLSWGDIYTAEAFSPVRDKELVRREAGGAATREEYREKNGAIYLGGQCRQLWDAPQINFDGKILGCCVNYWGDFGVVKNGDLAAALNGNKMEYARGMLQGKRPEREGIPCTTCKIYKQMKAGGHWLRPPQEASVFFRMRKSAKLFLSRIALAVARRLGLA